MPETLPGFHDAELEGIQSSRSDMTLMLHFRTPDGGTRELRFLECRHWRVTDYWPQNVVFEIAILGGRNEEEGPVRKLVDWAYRSENGGLATGETIEAILRDILHGDLRVACVETSVGAEVAVVFRHFEVDPPPV